MALVAVGALALERLTRRKHQDDGQPPGSIRADRLTGMGARSALNLDGKDPGED